MQNEKYTRHCQFCGEEVERTNVMNTPVTCFDCKNIRKRLNTSQHIPVTNLEKRIWQTMKYNKDKPIPV